MEITKELDELLDLVVNNANNNNIPLGQIQMLINKKYRALLVKNS